MNWRIALLWVAIVLLSVLIASTIWATQKSRERTACYRRAPAVADCPQPGPFERAVRRINGVP